MNCATCQSLLALHVGQDLPVPQGKDLQAHLDFCLPCHALFQKEIAAYSVLRELAPGKMTGGIAAGLGRRLDAVDAQRHANNPLRSFAPWAAAAALLVASVLWLPDGGRNAVLSSDPEIVAPVASALGPSPEVKLQAVSDEELRLFLARNAGLLHRPSNVRLRASEDLPAQAHFREEF